MSVDGILAPVTSVVTAAVKWATQYITLVTGNPLLLLFVLMSFVGLGIGIIRRLIRL